MPIAKMPLLTAADDEAGGGFTDEERAAIKERAKELRASARRAPKKGKADPAEDRREVLEKIAELDEPDRSLAERIHSVVTSAAPELSPKTWYGMPAYAKGGKVVCFFQAAGKFKTRYATLGFNEAANLDDGDLWPVAYALTNLSPEVEERIAALVKKAAS